MTNIISIEDFKNNQKVVLNTLEYTLQWFENTSANDNLVVSQDKLVNAVRCAFNAYFDEMESNPDINERIEKLRRLLEFLYKETE